MYVNVGDIFENRSTEKKHTQKVSKNKARSKYSFFCRWLREREKLSHKLEKMTIKRRRLILEKGDSRLVEDLDDQVRISHWNYTLSQRFCFKAASFCPLCSWHTHFRTCRNITRLAKNITGQLLFHVLLSALCCCLSRPHLANILNRTEYWY